MSADHTRLVYSTATQGRCPTCGWPQRDCHCSSRFAGTAAVPDRIVARLRVEKKGRGGKTVTVIDGLPANEEYVKTLAAELKRSCGVGGTAGRGQIELQGEQRDRVRAALLARGLTVKG